jgi:hypothetical protein
MRKVAPSGKLPAQAVTPSSKLVVQVVAKAIRGNERKRIANNAENKTRLAVDDM